MLVADQAPAPVERCHEPARHYVCPNLVMSPPGGLEVRRTASGRLLLLMENYLVNAGPGRVQFRGHRNGRYRMDAVQIVDRGGGRSPIPVTTGAKLTWKYVDKRRGSFWKFQNAARFELWRINRDGDRTRLVRTGPKLDYCLRDLFRFRTGSRVPLGPVFGACSQKLGASSVTLGVSIGWADGYPYTYPQNWIDVTGQRGCFVIIHRADPLNHVIEASEADNTSRRVVRLPYHGGKQRCPRYRGLAAPNAS
jgi:hypothetical protein